MDFTWCNSGNFSPKVIYLYSEAARSNGGVKCLMFLPNLAESLQMVAPEPRGILVENRKTILPSLPKVHIAKKKYGVQGLALA